MKLKELRRYQIERQKFLTVCEVRKVRNSLISDLLQARQRQPWTALESHRGGGGEGGGP